MGAKSIPVRAAAPALERMLAMHSDALERRLLEFIRESGIKFRSREAFNRIGWNDGPEPKFARFTTRRGDTLAPSPDPMIWDLRAPLLHDEALACCAVLLWRRAQLYDAQWIGGIETASIPIVAGILAVNRAAGAPPLNGFYLRKTRKPDGLRRLLEGVPPPRSARVLLVDDLLNRGISKSLLLTYCRNNDLTPAAVLVVVDAERRGHEIFKSICPVEAVFTRRAVLSSERPASRRATMELVAAKAAVIASEHPARTTPQIDSGPAAVTASAQMNPEDIELVRLARDTVLFTALSGGKRYPTLREDLRGSAGYLPFLGRYLRERGPVFTRISKREFRDGVWINRIRGCQAVGLMDPEPGTIAEMTIKSAIVSATRARKVQPGAAAFHKPVWPEEIGDLSLFVYVVEELVPTRARTAEQLIEEGHDARGWGLIAEAKGYRGVVCGDLDDVPDAARQVAVACRKMQNPDEIRPHGASEVKFTRVRGRWLWDPARPKSTHF